MARQFLVGVLLILALSNVPIQLDAQVVVIPDPELQKAVRLALEKPEGDITVEEMEKLTYLDAGSVRRGFGPPIQSLEGIQSAINLTNLSLVGAYAFSVHVPSVDIEDFTPLAELPNLFRLDLYRNLLSSVSLPDGLTSLQQLDLEANRLTNPALPRGLTNLWWLDLEVNLLTNLTLPDDLTNLSVLGLSFNRFTHFRVSGHLPRLESLGLMGNNITNLVMPDDLAGLRSLFVSQLETLTVPYWIDLGGLRIYGFSKSNVTFHAGTIKIQSGKISWPGDGILEYKVDLSDEWIPLPAGSPIQLSPVDDLGFFRIRVDDPPRIGPIPLSRR